MKLRFLGTGWSHGVPVIGCDCRVCRQRDPRNVRRRPSVQILDGDTSVVIDVGPDFRDQVLRFGVSSLDAVFITHAHADHVMGLDDVRRFTWRNPDPLRIWAETSTRERLRTLYPYADTERTPGKAVPRVEFRTWHEPVDVGRLRFIPFPVPHGGLACYGVRIEGPGGTIGYVPDCSDLPGEAREHLRHLDVLALNALRPTPHPSHLTFDRSRELMEEIGATESYFTHMGCPLDYHEIEPVLPPGLHMAYDGLEVAL